MTNTTSTTWKCDRCKFEAVEPERGQPVGWSSLLPIYPPLGEAQGKRIHLCPECSGLFDTWIQEGAQS